MSSSLILPMSFIIFYIGLFGIYVFLVRFRSVLSKTVSPKYFKTYDISAGLPPEYIVRVGRHFDNLMQGPVFYLVSLLVCIHFGLQNPIVIILAWIYCLSRIAHTFIHLGRNHVLFRAGTFFVGWIVILWIWVIILLHHLSTIAA